MKEESSAYFFWAIYITLVLLAIGNLITTLIVVHVLRFVQNPMFCIYISVEQ